MRRYILDGRWVMAVPNENFWSSDTPNPCWVCGDPTNWVYLDIGYQHPDCDAYPSPEGDVTIIRGRKTVRA